MTRKQQLGVWLLLTILLVIAAVRWLKLSALLLPTTACRWLNLSE
ncbi:MAG: hypothetical protein SF097_26260 [Acidobacteriota bacterium]|nr:hypothetical protein [Acidobacteriota bacterium]